MGDNCNDTGYMVLKNVRIPREYMLSRHQRVTRDGQYIANKIDAKLHYSTMMFARTGMISSSSSRLSYACTIATRYNAVRKQGFIDNSTKNHDAPENVILDYRLQQLRLFKQISTSFAITFTSKWMAQRLNSLEG